MNKMDEFNYLSSLEKKLSEALRPVRPDPGFIHSLHKKLSQGSNVFVEKRGIPTELIVLSLGLFTGFICVWLLGRHRV
jgi:hypothetical protein